MASERAEIYIHRAELPAVGFLGFAAFAMAFGAVSLLTALSGRQAGHLYFVIGCAALSAGLAYQAWRFLISEIVVLDQELLVWRRVSRFGRVLAERAFLVRDVAGVRTVEVKRSKVSVYEPFRVVIDLKGGQLDLLTDFTKQEAATVAESLEKEIAERRP